MLVTRSPNDLTEMFQQGGIIAYPTEAIYGLGCDPDNEKAVLRLLTIKNRPIEKGLILIAADFSQVKKYLKPLNEAQKILTAPSRTTYTFPSLDSTPHWLTGNFDSLAIRITTHPLVRQLSQILDSPLISTSANLSGQAPAKNFAEMLSLYKASVGKSVGLSIDAILNGETSGLQNPSSICDSITGKLLRS